MSIFRFTQYFKILDIEQVGFAVWALQWKFYMELSKTGLILEWGHHPQEQHNLLTQKNPCLYGDLWQTPAI